MAVVLLLGACAAPAAPRDPARPLNLSMQEVLQFPADFEAFGVVSRGDQIVSWGHGPDEVLYRAEDRRWHALTNAPRAPFAAALDDANHVWVLDSASRTSVQLDLARGTIATVPTAMPRTPDAATRFGGRWLVSATNPDSTASVVSLSGTRIDTLLTVRPTSNGVTTARARLLLTVVDDTLVATNRFYPFTIRFLTKTGKLHREWQPDLAGAANIPATALDRFVALSVVAVDGVYLLTLAELTSVRRALVIIDATGRILRYREIDVPLAFIGATPEHLISLRRVRGIQEVVIHRWSWGPPGQSAAAP